jgi:hypothetical protein
VLGARRGVRPIETASWVATSLATFGAVRSLRSGVEEAVDGVGFIQATLAGDGG